jgi:hypothetical protein
MIKYCADWKNPFGIVHENWLYTGLSTTFPHFLWKRMINHYFSVVYGADQRRQAPDQGVKERF